MPEPDDLFKLCGLLERAEIDAPEFFEAFTRQLAGLIGCSRAGVWMFTNGPTEPRTMHCIAMYDAPLDLMVQVDDMGGDSNAPYFDALLHNGCVVASDARINPSTVCFLNDYLLPLDIHSLLDVCFSVNGVVFGAFTCEQAGVPVQWSQRQVQLLRQIGSRASLTLMRAANASVDTTPGALWETSGPNRFITLAPPPKPDKPATPENTDTHDKRK